MHSSRALSALLLPALLISGCQPQSSKPAAKEKPAKVEAHPTEQDIYRIILTEKAEQRLQIATVPVERRSMPRSRLLGGEIAIPDGQRTPLMAPVTGTLLPIDNKPMAAAGQTVQRGDPLFQMLPMLPPEREVPNAAERVQMANAQALLATARIQAEGDIKQAQAQIDAADIALNRAQQLFDDKAGSRRAVDDADAALKIAQAAKQAAEDRQRELQALSLSSDSDRPLEVAIAAPASGILQTLSVQPGQVVNAGALLLEVVQVNPMWVRVPVYAGQTHEVDTTAAARIKPMSASADDREARPIVTPPTANALASSVDLYYEVDNTDQRFRPGERVEVQVPLLGSEDSFVVPRSAVLRDIYGTAWVYEKSGDHEFRRHRVAVAFTTDKFAVLNLGPPEGTQIVTDGAAELFGTEFGAGK
ncbi:MAG: efflux RND transporter periplasmic adaptor subunit [Planctomycetaceae bacterium]